MKQMGYSYSTSLEDSRQKQNNKLNKIVLWSSKLILFCQIAEHKDHTPIIYLLKKPTKHETKVRFQELVILICINIPNILLVYLQGKIK